MKNKLPSITDSYLFKFYAPKTHIEEKMKRLITKGNIVQPIDIRRQLSDIEKLYSFASKNNVLSDLNHSRVIPYYLDDNEYSLPSTIPFFLFAIDGKVKSIVNLSNAATINKNEVYNIDTKNLFNLLQGGTVLASCYEKFKKIQLNTTIIKNGSRAYSKLLSRVIQKMFNFPYASYEETVAYLCALFFLVNQLGHDFDNERTHNYAAQSCKVPQQAPKELIKRKFNEEDFTNLDTFCKAMSEKLTFMKELTTGGLVSEWLKMYMVNMLFGLEYLPIFLYNLFAVEIDAYINNKNTIESVCIKEILELYKAFFLLT